MSNTMDLKSQTKTTRVQVGNLEQQEKQLRDKEAESVKGGGGPSGGVNVNSGEEIPQKKQN